MQKAVNLFFMISVHPLNCRITYETSQDNEKSQHIRILNKLAANFDSFEYLNLVI
jgi:hypothetical protein